jgi:Uma2 family endonuclease
MQPPTVTDWTPIAPPDRRPPVELYPDSDGQPMADNTRQWDYIALIKNGFDVLFQDRPDVFVGGDLLWYAEEGNPKERLAPDALIAFGRPKGYRGSYKPWAENGVEPQVVFEVLSPSNTRAEMEKKLLFYQKHGVEEYYEYDPDRGELLAWSRQEGWGLVPVEDVYSWVSPRTGVRFQMEGLDLVILRPDGMPFLNAIEMNAVAEKSKARAMEERSRAEKEKARAEKEKARADKLAAMLRAAGIDPDAA